MIESPISFARACADIALEAAMPIMKFYTEGFVPKAKSDGSLVTEADIAADELIQSRLHANWPDIPVISEESAQNYNGELNQFFLVDPLDGTREFVNKTGEFTINIALIINGTPVIGVIYAPSIKELFIGADTAFHCRTIDAGEKLNAHNLEMIATRSANLQNLTALGSLSHSDADTRSYLERLKVKDVRQSGSSLKFCKIANSQADIYPRFGPTMGWDIAAGDAILRAAGGAVINADGGLFRYSSQDLLNGPFLALGDKSLFDVLKPDFMSACRNRHRVKSDIAE